MLVFPKKKKNPGANALVTFANSTHAAWHHRRFRTATITPTASTIPSSGAPITITSWPNGLLGTTTINNSTRWAAMVATGTPTFYPTAQGSSGSTISLTINTGATPFKMGGLTGYYNGWYTTA